MPRPPAERPTYSLARRGDRWYVQWWDGERARRLSTGTGDEREARRYLAAHIAGANTPAQPAQPTIGAILDHYLDDTHGHVAADDTLKYAAAALRSVLGDLQPRH